MHDILCKSPKASGRGWAKKVKRLSKTWVRPWLKTKAKSQTRSAVGDTNEVPRLRATGQGICDVKALVWVESVGTKRMKELKWWECWTPVKKQRQMAWKAKWGQCSLKSCLILYTIPPIRFSYGLDRESSNICKRPQDGCVGQEGLFVLCVCS